MVSNKQNKERGDAVLIDQSMVLAASSFDPFEWQNFYFSGMSRDEATRLLSAPNVEIGTFLLRKSSHNTGDYSMSVRESEKGDVLVRHYLIKKRDDDSGFVLGDNHFPDIPQCLHHYKMRILDQTPLTMPYSKPVIERVQALFRFEAARETDLSFEIGEHLDILEKEDPEWWQARNAMRSVGLVPAKFLEPVDSQNGDRFSRGDSAASSSSEPSRISASSIPSETDAGTEPRLPAVAIVVHDRTPNAYDSSALRLTRGQRIEVFKKIGNGFYEGICNGHQGTFPYTYVRWEIENM